MCLYAYIYNRFELQFNGSIIKTMENCIMVLSQLSTQFNEGGLDKQLAQTHETARAHDSCPNCNKRANKIIFYSCCLTPGCSHCYEGFHYLQCPKKARATIQYPTLTQKTAKIKCQRCELQISNIYESCKQCRVSYMCQSCSNHTHNSLKFGMHSRTKHKTVDRLQQNSILTCTVHNKIRNIINQSSQLICADCNKNKKYKVINYQAENSIQTIKLQLQALNKDIRHRQFQHKNKWKQLKHQLNQQYNKLLAILNQRYIQNSTALKQMQEYDMRIIDKAVVDSKKVMKQCYLDYNQANVDKKLLTARFHVLASDLMKHRQNVQSAQLFVYKITNAELQKVEAVIKNFTVSKLKLREPDDKENNLSVKKWNNSSNQKPIGNNLSMSRRSLSKSISKIENPRISDARESMTSSISRSQNLSQQINTQPIRNATPPHSSKQPVNSSDKKSAIMRQSSIMSAKLQDITPVMLNFDSKQSCGSRINFLSNKAEEDSNNLTDSNTSQARPSKRKSDYFDLRDRMRKPNLISNRFSKQQR